MRFDVVLGQTVAEYVVVVLAGVDDETRQSTVPRDGNDGGLLVEAGLRRRDDRDGERLAVERPFEALLMTVELNRWEPVFSSDN